MQQINVSCSQRGYGGIKTGSKKVVQLFRFSLFCFGNLSLMMEFRNRILFFLLRNLMAFQKDFLSAKLILLMYSFLEDLII